MRPWLIVLGVLAAAGLALAAYESQRPDVALQGAVLLTDVAVVSQLPPERLREWMVETLIAEDDDKSPAAVRRAVLTASAMTPDEIRAWPRARWMARGKPKAFATFYADELRAGH